MYMYVTHFLSLSHTHTHAQCSLPLKPLPVGVHCMAFNHNSNLLITGGADGMIRLFGVCPYALYTITIHDIVQPSWSIIESYS